jgi:hypothetical protein
MSKSFRHYKKCRKTCRKTRRKMCRKTRRKTKLVIRKKHLKGGNEDKVICSMCEKNVTKDKTLIPRECLMKHGMSAHRICKDCWWDTEAGFAREDASHKCPGCIKGLPLSEKEQSIIDLTEDD